MTLRDLQKHNEIIDLKDSVDAKDITIRTFKQRMDLSLGSKDIRQYFDAQKDKNINKPTAYETVMVNVVNHLWDQNYF